MGEQHAPIVLVVEDDPSTREALLSVFRNRGWLVRNTPTAAEAVALLEAGYVPDGMILDLMLPDGPGTLVFDRVRARGLGTRVAIVTGTTNPTLLASAQELKPDLLLIKPIAPDVLARLIEGWSGVMG